MTTSILSLSFEEVGLSSTEVLDWLTSLEINRGKNLEKYWIINTDTQINNIHRNVDVEKIVRLLYNCKTDNITSLIIRKNEQKTSKSENTVNSNEDSVRSEEQKPEVSSDSVDVSSDTT